MQRFFAQGQPAEAGVVIIDADQLALYETLKIPRNWERLIVEPMQGFTAKANLAYQAFPDQDWYAFGGDDAIGRTPFWDSQLSALAACKGHIAWGNDLLSGGRCTHPFLPADLVREFGWVCHPALKHLYVDTVWEHIAYHVGIDCYCAEIIHEAHHFSNGKLAPDRTARERMHEHDAATFKTIDLLALTARAIECVSLRS